MPSDRLLRDWATRRGLGNLDANLHVTILYSTRVVPWTADPTPLVVRPEAFQRIARLGKDNALVLMFDAPELARRWQAGVAAGAAVTYRSYKGHVTLFYGGEDTTNGALPDFPLVLDGELASVLGGDAFQLTKRLTSRARERANAPDPDAGGVRDVIGRLSAAVQKGLGYNPFRAADGQFASGPGGGGAGTKPKKGGQIGALSNIGVGRYHDAAIQNRFGGTENLMAYVSDMMAELPAGNYRAAVGGFGDLSVTVQIVSQDDGNNTRMTRQFRAGEDGVNTYAYHDYFIVDAEAQGAGIGRQMLARSVERYRALDFTHIKTTANLQAGAYAWARMGFVPESKEVWAYVRNRAHFRLRDLEGRVPAEALQQVRDLMDGSDDPRTIRRLAAARYGDVNIGKEVLRSQSYDATFDLNDQESLDILAHYTKGS